MSYSTLSLVEVESLVTLLKLAAAKALADGDHMALTNDLLVVSLKDADPSSILEIIRCPRDWEM